MPSHVGYHAKFGLSRTNSIGVRKIPEYLGRGVADPLITHSSHTWASVLNLMYYMYAADADKPARRVYRSVKVSKYSTIPYVRHNFLLRNRNFVFKTRRFYDIRLQKYRDLEIRIRGHSKSLKVVPFYRFGVVSY